MNRLLLLSEGGIDTSLMWLLYVGIGFFFAAIIMGWLSSSMKREPRETPHEIKKPKPKK